MPISISARSQVDLPLRLTAPYSVTIKPVQERGVVTTEPGGRIGVIRDTRLPSLSVLVDGRHKKLLPPLER